MSIMRALKNVGIGYLQGTTDIMAQKAAQKREDEKLAAELATYLTFGGIGAKLGKKATDLLVKKFGKEGKSSGQSLKSIFGKVLGSKKKDKKRLSGFNFVT